MQLLRNMALLTVVELRPKCADNSSFIKSTETRTQLGATALLQTLLSRFVLYMHIIWLPIR